MDLKGKTAIVTGGGRDIGRACVLELAARGANVAINYMASSEGADSAVADEIAVADAQASEDASQPVTNWDFVAPTAVVEEYMENMYQCVSAI